MANYQESYNQNYEEMNEEEYYEEGGGENEATKEQEPKEPQKTLEGPELLEALKKQIDYYFSKENLMTDRYLLSQMNSDLFVPVKVIENFKMIKNLTEDHDKIIEAMKECSSITLNEEQSMVKPNLKAQRNTIILREIASDTDSSIIKNLFGNQFGNFEVKSEIGNCWYVNFENDEVTLQALEYVRNQTFNGLPIKARIKTESTLRVFQLAASSNPPTFYNNIAMQNNTVPNTMGYQGAPYQGWENQDQNYPPRNFEGGRRGFRSGGRRKEGFRGRNRGYRGGRDGRKRRGGSSNSGGHSTPQQVPNLGPTHFPPLVPTSPSSKQSKQGGYSKDFIKYSKQEFVDVIQNMKTVTKPEMDEIKGSLVILSEPNLELEVTKPFPKKKTALDVAKGAIASKPKEHNNQPKENKEKEGNNKEKEGIKDKENNKENSNPISVGK